VWHVKNVRAAGLFWSDLGMRPVHVKEGNAILELRGGTHLILLPAEGDARSDPPLDLMVDDLAVTDPEGHAVTVNSSHVVGKV